MRTRRDERRESKSHSTAAEAYDRKPNQSSEPLPIQEGDNEDSASVLSSRRLPQGTTSPRPSRKGEPDTGPLGLNVVYTPENGHKVDIVFIHGLGGTSQLTWSKHRNLELFWPLTFLPLEPDLCLARILTFGYNADFRKSGNLSTSVLDFAKDLLFDLKYATDDDKNDLNMGSVSNDGSLRLLV